MSNLPERIERRLAEVRARIEEDERRVQLALDAQDARRVIADAEIAEIDQWLILIASSEPLFTEMFAFDTDPADMEKNWRLPGGRFLRNGRGSSSSVISVNDYVDYVALAPGGRLLAVHDTESRFLGKRDVVIAPLDMTALTPVDVHRVYTSLKAEFERAEEVLRQRANEDLRAIKQAAAIRQRI